MRAQKSVTGQVGITGDTKKVLLNKFRLPGAKLVEFKRSKEVVPYTGIQEAAFQDV